VSSENEGSGGLKAGSYVASENPLGLTMCEYLFTGVVARGLGEVKSSKDCCERSVTMLAVDGIRRGPKSCENGASPLP